MDYNFNIWYETYDPEYVDINLKSRVPERWLQKSQVSNKYSNSIIKPVNQYLEYICPPPRLISIDSNCIVLEQSSYAEILLDNTKETFSSIEKVWLRQYYQSNTTSDSDKEFAPQFLYFVPWIIDEDISATILPVEDSPFSVKKQDIMFTKISNDTEYVSPPSVLFAFKSHGSHMKYDNGWGIIRKNTPVYRIMIEASDIIVERVKEFYEKEQE